LFHKIIDGLRDLTDEVSFDFNDQGLSIQAIGSDHISLCACFLQNSVFDTYTHIQDISVGIHINSISKIMKCSNSNDTMEMFIYDEHIHFVFTSPCTGINQGRIVEFDMKLLNIDEYRMSIPEQDYECNIEMSSVVFQRIIKELYMISDTVNIECKADERVVFAMEGDIGSGSISLNSSDTLHIDCDKSVRSSYSLKHLSMFTKAGTISSNVYIRLSNAYPLMVEYPITDGGYMKYYIAPKTDDD
jgi:proliferating cell nuclear antigen